MKLWLDDLRPHILRTRDGGKSWAAITAGIPDGETVNVVREDPVRKGLLFAGTERTVYVSFDEGDHWSSLRQNLPVTSIRDLVIHEDDLVIATHGRSFWILDDISPLRQMNALTDRDDFHLYAPQRATRVRWNMNSDTPLPPEEPAGQNPPDGAILYYRLSAAAKSVAIEIRDGAGRLVRRYQSDDPPEPVDPNLNVPTYWIRPQENPAITTGLHRFIWDLHYTHAAGQAGEYPIAAIYRDTVKTDRGPWAAPGAYRVTLVVDGRSQTQPLHLRMDPRVGTAQAILDQQLELSLRLRDRMNLLAAKTKTPAGVKRHAALGDLLEELQWSDNPPTADLLAAVAAALAEAEAP